MNDRWQRAERHEALTANQHSIVKIAGDVPAEQGATSAGNGAASTTLLAAVPDSARRFPASGRARQATPARCWLSAMPSAQP